MAREGAVVEDEVGERPALERHDDRPVDACRAAGSPASRAGRGGAPPPRQARTQTPQPRQTRSSSRATFALRTLRVVRRDERPSPRRGRPFDALAAAVAARRGRPRGGSPSCGRGAGSRSASAARSASQQQPQQLQMKPTSAHVLAELDEAAAPRLRRGGRGPRRRRSARANAVPDERVGGAAERQADLQRRVAGPAEVGHLVAAVAERRRRSSRAVRTTSLARSQSRTSRRLVLRGGPSSFDEGPPELRLARARRAARTKSSSTFRYW